jgi:hypothetical protein
MLSLQSPLHRCMFESLQAGAKLKPCGVLVAFDACLLALVHLMIVISPCDSLVTDRLSRCDVRW